MAVNQESGTRESGSDTSPGDTAASADNLQSKISEDKNRDFFAPFADKYRESIEKMDTYVNIHRDLDVALEGVEHLCDIGNGGVFAYDTNRLSQITAIDLFLDEGNNPYTGSNIAFVRGNALDLPVPDSSVDGVLMSMLLHHLTGDSVKCNRASLRLALKEAYRILKPNGRCFVVESCLAGPVFALESLLYPLITKVITKILTHPPTFQYSSSAIAEVLNDLFTNCQVKTIERGKWQMFLGFKMPTIILPTFPTLFISTKI